MQILNIYFPTSWLEIGILCLSIIVLTIVIKNLLLAGHKKVDMPSIIIFIVLATLVLIWLFIAKGIPGIKNIWQQIKIPEETKPWIWVSLGVLVLLVLIFIFRKNIPNMRRPSIGFSWLWVGIPLLVIAGIWGYKQYQISRFVSGISRGTTSGSGNNFSNNNHSAKTYPSYSLDGENIMKKDEWKEFEFVASNENEPTFHFDSPKGYDRFIITYQKKDDPGITWKREVWRDETTGEVHRELIGSKPPPFEGPCLVKTSKDCVVLSETRIVKK